MVDQDPPPCVERLVAAFNDHDIERYMDQYAADVTFSDPLVDDVSADELREHVLALFDGFPDARIERDRVLTAGDVTALEVRFVGTHEGTYQGIPPTGNHASIPAVLVMTVSEDKITSRRDYWDQGTFKAELGLTFPAVVGQLPTLAAGKLRSLA